MKKTYKTMEIVAAYSKIKDAKLGKLEDEQKFAVIRIGKKLKQIAVDFEEFVQDAREKLKDEKFDEMQEKVQKWQGKTAQTDDEKIEVTAINAYYNIYNKKVEECVKPEAEKEVEIDIEPLTEDAFMGFVSANDFSISEILDLENVISN